MADAEGVSVRPMMPGDIDDVIGVVEVTRRAAGWGSSDPLTDEQLARMRTGMRRFVELDPGGAWVAANDGRDGGQIVGMAESMRRGDFWGLSMLFVDPAWQGKGVGRRLIDCALGYADGARVRMILSSSDPKAFRRYAMAGHRMHPAVEATGTVDRNAIPVGLAGRTGTQSDLDLVAAVDARLGRSRADDASSMLEQGTCMEVIDKATARGFALHNGSRLMMLGATDDNTAALLLWRVLAATDGDVAVWHMTSEQDWAIQVTLAAGLKLTPGGAIFSHGLDRLPEAWSPSGWHF